MGAVGSYLDWNGLLVTANSSLVSICLRRHGSSKHSSPLFKQCLLVRLVALADRLLIEMAMPGVATRSDHVPATHRLSQKVTLYVT
jgi:hypothetical protein